MSLMEAEDLAETIDQETGGTAQVRRIGNGEWIIFYDYHVYIWNAEDWEHFITSTTVQNQV